MHRREDHPFETVVRNLAHGLVWLLWATIGLVVWFGILARAVLAYGFGLFVRIISNADTKGLESVLDYALHFWLNGFERLKAARQRSDVAFVDLPPVDSKRFIYESIYALAFVAVWCAAGPIIRGTAVLIYEKIVAVVHAILWFYNDTEFGDIDGSTLRAPSFAYKLPESLSPHRVLITEILQVGSLFVLLILLLLLGFALKNSKKETYSS